MASSVSTMKFMANNKFQQFDHDPADSTAATAGTYQAMRDYGGIFVSAMSTALTGNGITLLEIVAAEDSSGTNATVIKTSGAVVCDAVGDYVVEEATAEEINQVGKAAGYDFTHATYRITCANAADEANAVIILLDSKRATSGLTADTIA